MYRGLLSKGERMFGWALVALALFGVACGAYLILSDESDGYLLLGAAIVGINTYWGGRCAFMLWEDTHG